MNFSEATLEDSGWWFAGRSCDRRTEMLIDWFSKTEKGQKSGSGGAKKSDAVSTYLGPSKRRFYSFWQDLKINKLPIMNVLE
jgi:hypothetical protein